MSRSKGCLFSDAHTFLAGFTESLAWFPFGWLGSQAWPDYISRERGISCVLQDQNPSGIVNPGPHSQHWPQRRLNALTVSLEYLWRLMCQHSGSLGLPAGDMHPGFPAGGHGNGTRLTSLSHLCLLSLDKGRVRRNYQSFSGVSISGSRPLSWYNYCMGCYLSTFPEN